MSLIIKGMEMPENCGECGFLRKLEKATPYTSQFWCCIDGKTVLKHEKSKYCPLVPLPEGHGRLGDLDALDRAFTDLRFNADGSIAHWDDRRNWCLHGEEIERLIGEAPTIIPAEGGGEDGN